MKAAFHRLAPHCVLVALTALALSACAPRLAEPAGSPVPDPAAAAAGAIRETTPVSPRQATFGWALNEAGTRLEGRGVARFEAPERIRLDLFGPRGETYLAAALVGDAFRIPAGAADRISLPSPALLWGALSVIRPPTGSRLVSATATDTDLVLRYQDADGDLFQFQIDQATGTPRLREVERVRGSGVLESVQLSYDSEQTPRDARYREWSEYRELTLDFEQHVEVASFPADIWSPPGASR